MVTTAAVKTKTLEQAKKLFMHVTEFGGAEREIIGGYPVTESASKMPWMTEDEFQELQLSINEHGLLDDVEMNANDEIVDGRNRMLACLSMDVEPVFKYAKLDEESTVVEVRNLHRRHLPAGVRASLYLKLHGDLDVIVDEEHTDVDDETSEATEVESKVEEKPAAPKKTIADHAKAAGVGERTMQQAITVEKSAIPEVKAAVESGTLPVGKAATIARKPEEEQRTAVEQTANGGGRGSRPEVSEATFSVDAYIASFEKQISKKLASVPPGLKDTVHRRMGESLGSTVRMERETTDLLNSESFVPYVEELVKQLPKTERAGAEKALAEHYGNIVTVKDSDAALAKITGIIESLGDREKKKLCALLGEQYKLPASTKPAEYLPALPYDVTEAIDVVVKESKHRAEGLKGNAGFMSDASEAVVTELGKIVKKLTLKKA